MTIIPKNTTLYPQWEAKHLLRYDTNGGNGKYEDSDLPSDVSDTVPSRDGYEFDGWMIDGVKVDSGDSVEDNGSDVTVVAQWTPVKQDVTPTKPETPKDDNKTDNGGNGSEIPKDDNIGQVTITKEYIEGTGGPVITLRGQALLTGE